MQPPDNPKEYTLSEVAKTSVGKSPGSEAGSSWQLYSTSGEPPVFYVVKQGASGYVLAVRVPLLGRGVIYSHRTYTADDLERDAVVRKAYGYPFALAAHRALAGARADEQRQAGKRNAKSRRG